MLIDPENLTRRYGAVERTAPMYTIRRYTVEDVPIIVHNIEVYCANHPFYKTLKFSREKLIWVLDQNKDNEDFYANLAVHPSDGPVAGLGAMTSGYAISQERYSQDIFQFVKNEYRDGKAWNMLITDFVNWSASKGLHNAQLSFTDRSRDAVLARALERWGFTYLGPKYIKVL